MKVEVTLPDGEVVAVDHSQLALKNNADNSGIILFAKLPDGRQLTVAAYDGAFLARVFPLVMSPVPVKESNHANPSGR
jgi:hypothetical protein